MATVRIRIKPEAFGAGQPLANQLVGVPTAEQDQRKAAVRVMVGTNKNSRYHIPGQSLESGDLTQHHQISVGLTGWEMTATEFNSLPVSEIRDAIASFVRRAVLLVEKDGAAQVADTVLAGTV